MSKAVYGLHALDEQPISQGARSLINAVDAISTDEGIYILVWGGASVIAEALNSVKSTSDSSETDEFVSKITFCSISDQDNAGPWIRFNFSKMNYIASIHAFNQYGHSAWVGISGELYNHFDAGGPDSSLVSKEWALKNIRSVGPLGKRHIRSFSS